MEVVLCAEYYLQKKKDDDSFLEAEGSVFV